MTDPALRSLLQHYNKRADKAAERASEEAIASNARATEYAKEGIRGLILVNSGALFLAARQFGIMGATSSYCGLELWVLGLFAAGVILSVLTAIFGYWNGYLSAGWDYKTGERKVLILRGLMEPDFAHQSNSQLSVDQRAYLARINDDYMPTIRSYEAYLDCTRYSALVLAGLATAAFTLGCLLLMFAVAS